MKFTYKWLQEYVSFDWTAEKVTQRLTMAGIEVERVESIGSSLKGVVIGQILASEKHPNADRLSVCRVTDGKSERQIVCGASNYKVGDKVPLATPGTKLPNGLAIKESKLRGVLSQGMLCSTVELGLGADADGLMILPGDAPLGKAFADFQGTSDILYDVEVTPNRPDWLSVIGVAREISALTGNELRIPEFQMAETGKPIDQIAAVRVEDSSLCPRYVARVIRGVKIGDSPDWLKARLESVGLRPINNVVDITNFVMLETGQPLHAFDYNLLADHTIVVRRAAAPEAMTLLDGSKHELTPEMLVIADTKRAVALAGVMGGLDSEIRETTTDVLLESAYFNPQKVRATAKRLALSTDSSYRFERGADIGMTDLASRRAAALIQQLAGGEIARGAIDTLSAPIQLRTVTLRFDKVNQLLGVNVPTENVIQSLNRLDLRVDSASDAACAVTVPTFRVDIEMEEDLVEEVCRIYGVENIPPSAPHSKASVSEFDARYDTYQEVRRIMRGLGFTEAVNQTLVSEACQQLVAHNLSLENRNVSDLRVQNPLAVDQMMLRRSLLGGLLSNLRVNVSRRNDDVKLFELGRVFASENGKPTESTMLSIAATGRRQPQYWQGADRDAEVDFYDVKGAIEEFAANIGVSSLQFLEAASGNPLFAQSATIQLNGRAIGCCGRVAQSVAKQFDLRAPAYLAELAVDVLLSAATVVAKYVPAPVFPAITRDVALIVSEKTTHADVMKVVKDFRNSLIEGVVLFDVFRGKHIPQGSKSLAYSMTYRAADRTLTDEEVNRIHEKLKQKLKESLGAEIRE